MLAASDVNPKNIGANYLAVTDTASDLYARVYGGPHGCFTAFDLGAALCL